MGASDSSSVVVSKPSTEAPVTGFHVKVTLDGKEVIDRQGRSAVN
jgi:hypothetical protein